MQEQFAAEQQARADEQARARAQAQEDKALLADLEIKRLEAAKLEAEIARRVQGLARGAVVPAEKKLTDKEEIARALAIAELVHRAAQTGGEVVMDPVTREFSINYPGDAMRTREEALRAVRKQKGLSEK